MKHDWQSKEDAIRNAEERTGEKFTLLPCPHCGHSANLTDPDKDPNSWGGYQWSIVCSSSHCRARVMMVADGWFEQIDGELNKHIPPNELYRDRVTDLRRMWNRRPAPSNPQEAVAGLCDDCPPVGYPTDKTRCLPCPRRAESRPSNPDTSTDRTIPAAPRWPRKGDRMKFLGRNGYDYELAEAMKIFQVGESYRVHDCNVQSWSHSVQFDGVKGWFNGVMFELCPASQTTPTEMTPLQKRMNSGGPFGGEDVAVTSKDRSE